MDKLVVVVKVVGKVIAQALLLHEVAPHCSIVPSPSTR
jgi:hypothetical protein